MPRLLRAVKDRFAAEGRPVEPFPAARDVVRAVGGLLLVVPSTPPDAVAFAPHGIHGGRQDAEGPPRRRRPR
ncbi:hypothetical protein AB0A69_08335 [Streptomyces sp. NPDC045431]|uniref:hypothetical protein n=1 Tax=Streptomyces sp. NPDC045431 TaxID=3155613 RepID=UPI0033EC43BC